MKTKVMNLISRANVVRFGLVIALGIFAASCNKEEEMIPDQNFETNQANIMDVLATFGQDNPQPISEIGYEEYMDIIIRGENPEEESFFFFAPRPTFRTLTVALIRTGLAGYVAFNQLTVFAPTDAAFAQLGLYPSNIHTVPNLREILLYHVIEGRFRSNQLSNGFKPTLNGAGIDINVDNGVTVNDASVVRANIWAFNGIIHGIDQVLFPPTMNLAELALSFDPEFSILVQALVKADLVGVVAEGGPFTVFAPTNAAFAALLEELPYDSLEEIPVDVLTQVLLYHVVEGRVFSSDLVSGPVTTLNGTFNVNTSNFTITDANGRVSGIITSLVNVQATNGVVHVIDRVILPTL